MIFSAEDKDEVDADRQSDAMKDQLRKDVASWNALRTGEGMPPAVKPATPATKSPTTRTTRQKAKPAEPTPEVAVEKKPFKMSYDGTTDRDYIAHRIKHGAR
jgi:hypothetical protein